MNLIQNKINKKYKINRIDWVTSVEFIQNRKIRILKQI